MTTTQIQIIETEAPSRSKGRGWARIGSGDTAVFAGTTPRTVVAELGDVIEVTIAVEIRRSTRVTKERTVERLVVTGDPSDRVELSLGSPQPYGAAITGVRPA